MRHVHSDRKWKILINNCCRTLSGHFFAYVCVFFTKLRFRRSFWNAERVWILNWPKSYDFCDFNQAKEIIGLSFFLGYILNFRINVIAPKCYQHEKHLFPFHSFCSLFLSKCSRWGILALILFSPTHFGKCNPNPIYTFYLFMLGLCNFRLAIKADFIFLQNVLGFHPNPQADIWLCFSFKKCTAFKFKIYLEMTKKCILQSIP